MEKKTSSSCWPYEEYYLHGDRYVIKIHVTIHKFLIEFDPSYPKKWIIIILHSDSYELFGVSSVVRYIDLESYSCGVVETFGNIPVN